jgi:small conductance mechanosensitive channel
MTSIFTLDFWQEFWRQALAAAAGRGLRIVIIIVAYAVARSVLFRLIDATLARLVARQGIATSEERANRLRTLQGLVRSVAGYVLFFLMIVMVLQALAVDVTGLITTAGVTGLAIGFGAQKLVKDVISGFFIIVEDQYAVGDYVTIGAATGTVEEIGMRITRLRDDMGRLWILSNGDVSTITNFSRAPVESAVEVSVGAGADLEAVRQAVDAAAARLMAEEGNRLLAPPKSLGVAGYDAAKTTLRVSVVTEPRAANLEQLRVRSAVRQELLAREIPLA